MSAFLNWITNESFWAQAIATALGAFLAFWLEHERRKRERIDSECVQINFLLATMGRMLTVAEILQEHGQQLREIPVPQRSLVPIHGLPDEAPGIGFDSLAFMFDTRDKKDPFVRIFGRLDVVQGKFDSLLDQLRDRNSLICELMQVSTAIPVGQQGEYAVMRRQDINARLSQIAEALENECDECVVELKEVTGQIRKAAHYRHAKRQFLNLYPTTDKNGPPV